jgi:hypothetical protein
MTLTSNARVHFADLLPCERLGIQASSQAVAQAIRADRSDRNKFVFSIGPRSENSRAGASLKGQRVYARTLALGISWKDDKDESRREGKAHLILPREV